MAIRITSNAAEWKAAQERAGKQIAFATALALTRTAQAVRTEEIAVMKRVFDRPTRFTLNSLQVRPATKERLFADVETKLGGDSVPAGRYLGPQVYGGGRRMKSHERKLGGYTSPSTFATLNAFGNLPGSTYTRILSQLGALGENSATSSAPSKRKRSREAFFRREKVIYSRKDDDITPILIITDAPSYKPIFPFEKTGERVWSQMLPLELSRAIDQALATAR